MSQIVELLQGIGFSSWFSFLPAGIAAVLSAFFAFFVIYAVISLILKIIGTFL